MSRITISAIIAVTLQAGCGEPIAVEAPSPVAPTELTEGAPAQSRADPTAETRRGSASELEPLPHPDLSPLKEAVHEQVEQELTELEPLLADPATTPADLAERFGRLGRVYHSYGLLDPAAAAYRNAERLAGEDLRWPYLQAVLAQKQGDTQVAEWQLRRALQLAPDDLPSILRLAELRLLAGQTEDAERLFQEALDRQPESAAAAHGLARVATTRGEHEAAVRLLRRVIELQPAASSVHTLLAQAYTRVGDRRSAERHIAQRGSMPVVFDDPLVEALSELLRGVGIHLDRGRRAFGAGRHEEAIAEYRTVLALEPENPTALRSLALTLATAGRHDEAIAHFERMLEIYPDHQLALLEHATVLLQRGREAEAVASLQRAIRTDPDFKNAHFNLATAYSRLERWQEAAAGFREVLRIDRDEIEARYYLGVALDELERPREAVTELRLAVAADPGHLTARQRLGAILDRLGEVDDAIEQFQEVLGLEVADEEKALASYQLGRLLSAKGRDKEALASFQKAVALFPQLWQAHFAVANWLSRHGRHLEAAEIFGRLATSDPANVLARQREAAALISGGRFARARQRLEDGLATHPRSFELASLLARLLATAPDDALRDGARALQLAQELLQARRSIDQAETVAMALAELERFDEAAALQRQIIDWAASEGQRELASRLRRNLERYENRQPVRQLPG
jgi:tetratricopeptide (TPR) repeat protein